MPLRRLAELSPELMRYLNYAVVALALAAEVLRAFLRSQGGGGTSNQGGNGG